MLSLLRAGVSEVPAIQDLLYEWGRWHHSSGIHLGYPSEATFHRMSRHGRATVKAASISDDEALGVDKAVSELRTRSEGLDLRWEVLARTYLWHQSQSAIARHLRLSRHTVRDLLVQAEAWVDARLDIQQEEK